MSDGIITTILVLSVLVGIGGASFMVFRSPAFWGDVIKEVALKAWPAIVGVITKPESDEVRAARQQCERMGGKWDHIKKRCNR